MREELVLEIEKIRGFNFINRKEDKVVKLMGKLSKLDFTKFITVLRTYNESFSIYDVLYPSMSDPGAYINYSIIKNELVGYWSMTLGNHGWSGGIYHVDELTIINQLKNLHDKNLINEIKIGSSAFMSNYDSARKDRNEEINNILIRLHE